MNDLPFVGRLARSAQAARAVVWGRGETTGALAAPVSSAQPKDVQESARSRGLLLRRGRRAADAAGRDGGGCALRRRRPIWWRGDERGEPKPSTSSGRARRGQPWAARLRATCSARHDWPRTSATLESDKGPLTGSLGGRTRSARRRVSTIGGRARRPVLLGSATARGAIPDQQRTEGGRLESVSANPARSKWGCRPYSRVLRQALGACGQSRRRARLTPGAAGDEEGDRPALRARSPVTARLDSSEVPSSCAGVEVGLRAARGRPGLADMAAA